jgi:ATP-dependent Clp protease ATP-binding subunit ClpB
VNFKNTVLILTSNLGASFLLEGISGDGRIREEVRETVLGEVRRTFRPEFLNRLDEMVLFKPLTIAEVERIVELLANDLRVRLAERNVTLEMTPEAVRWIAREAYDPVYGARPLKRFLARELETRLARKILSGEIPDGAAVTVALDQDRGLTLRVSPFETPGRGDAGTRENGTDVAPTVTVEGEIVD